MSDAAARRTGMVTCLRLFARERRGIAAIEFAVLLPVLLVLYLGTFEVGQAISIKLNNSLAARTVADLASQYTTIYNADMTSILGASTTVMAPSGTESSSSSTKIAPRSRSCSTTCLLCTISLRT